MCVTDDVFHEKLRTGFPLEKPLGTKRFSGRKCSLFERSEFRISRKTLKGSRIQALRGAHFFGSFLPAREEMNGNNGYCLFPHEKWGVDRNQTNKP